MKRLLYAVPVLALLLSAGTASADWLRIKVHVDPTLPDANGGNGNQGGMPGGMGGMPGMPGGMGPGMPGGGMPGMGGGMRGMRGGFGGMPGMGMRGGMPGMGMRGGMPGMGMRGMPGGFGGGSGSGMPAGYMGSKGGSGGGMPAGYMGAQGGSGSGGPGMPGGFQGGFGGPGMPGSQPGDEAAKEDGPYLYVYIEVHDIKDHGNSTYVNHKWGKQGLLMDMKDFISKEYVPGRAYAQEFAERFKKTLNGKNAKGKGKGSDNVADAFWDLATKALAHGLHREFHLAMGELVKLDPNTTKDYQTRIKNYLRVRQALQTPPAGDDPAIKAFTDQLIADGYSRFHSERGDKKPGFYVLYTKSKAAAKQKLVQLEANLDNFYYWFALQNGAEQPPLPRTRLVAVMNDPGTFENEKVSWGVEATVADGFTPRRNNIIFLADDRQDPNYARLSAALKPDIQSRLEWFRSGGANITEDMLLSGKIWEDKRSGQMVQKIGEIQTMLILRKALQEDAERATITHEGTRQLLVASGLFPRHVSVPEWVLSGLASYFETPVQAVYPGVGLPSWTHLVSFKHLQKTELFAKPAEVLYNTLTDRYFAKAREDSEFAAEHRDNDHLADKAHEAWELGRCTAWAFVYYLASNDRINDLLAYGRELNQLPRDLELGEHALQGCAARAFKISDTRNAGRIDMKDKASRLANAWFKQMSDLTLELVQVEDFHTTMLSKQFTAKRRRPARTGSSAPGSAPPGFNGPGSTPPGFGGPGNPMNPMPPGGFKGPGGSSVPPNGPGGNVPPPGFNGPGGNAPPPPPGGFKGPKGSGGPMPG